MIGIMGTSLRSAALDAVLISVWRQALIERVETVTLDSAKFSVRRTAKHKLAQVDFEFGGELLRGLEQNPQTASRWAQMARKSVKVMQFLSAGRYVAVVVDGKITHYDGARTQRR
jgi:hypothetical protein